MAEFDIVLDVVDERSVRLRHEHANALLTFSLDGERMSVSSVFVSSVIRRNGIGQAVLQKAREVAVERRIQRITASIISRESLDLFTKVFGEASIKTEHVGLYEMDITEVSGMEQYTNARLDFILHGEATRSAESQSL
ncbi:MAG TPA: GNAT family N-acetyltransferase [Candidatus Saccharimonadales bacterium]|nr:GNAT family N-acetyltransferase [Candidatus Saccharimonadales bacterium]